VRFHIARDLDRAVFLNAGETNILLAGQEETALVMEVSEIHGLLYLPSPRNRVLAKTAGIPLSPPTLFEICITHVDRTQVVSSMS
jgi:hypothetical protein